MLHFFKRKWKYLSHFQIFGTPWTVDFQAPLSMEFSREEYWSGLPFPSTWDLPNPGIKPSLLHSGRFFIVWATREAQILLTLCDRIDLSPPGSSAHGILQARTLEWAAMPSSSISSWPRDWTHVSHVSCIGRWVLYRQCHLGSLTFCEMTI